MTTLAEYNNNPGNIRPAKGVKYEGMIGVDDNGFAVFEAPKYGQQALQNDLTYKLEKRGIRTPSEFVDVYSPASKENPEDARDNYKIYIAHKLGLDSTNDPFPDNAVPKLAQAVTSFEGGTWNDGNKEEVAKAPEASVEAAEPKGDTVPASTDSGQAANAIMGVVGGAAGAKLAGSIETGKKAIPLLQTLYNKATGSTDYMNKPQSNVSLQRYANSQLGHDLRVPLSELEKVVDKPIRTMSEVQSALKQVQGAPRTAKVASINPATGQARTLYTPARPPVDLSAFRHTPTMASKVADEVGHGIEMVKGALPSVGRVGVGALGGALAGSQLYDAFNQYQKDGQGMHIPTARNAAQFASGAGGALGMLPFGVTQAAGAALQVPELAYQGYEGLKGMNERRKQATREDVDRMLMNVDAMGNPVP